ncbi:unnamed protein product [Polarella glacialis]|uniref:Uncharacterized protein n=1 Tax=Polarella glacialis TaxID=89957 RepID=A0A813KTS2_POLGL|nr:unnamed protein product [Polarella glacialis]
MSPRDQRPGAKVQRGMHELRHPPIQRFPSYPAPTSQQSPPSSRGSCQVACLATTTAAAAGQSAETLLGAMSGVKLPLLAADVAGHDMAPLGCSLSLRQGQGQARLAARGSFLANLAVEVTLQQTGATSASGATYALVQCHQPAEPRVMAILGGVLQQQQQEQEQPQHVVFALGSAPFVPDPACCLRALPPRPAEISLGARLLLLPLRTSSFPLCKPAAPWQQRIQHRPSMPTSLFAGLCLLGSATRLLNSSCAQQAPCERRLWAPLRAQQIPPVSQFRFAEPKVQKQVPKQAAAAAAAVGVVCQALPLVAVFGAATSSHDAALLGFSSPCRSCLQQQPQQQQQQQPSFLWSACRPESKVRVPPLAAGSLMAVHGGRLPQAAPTTAARGCTTITGAAD